MIGVTVVLLTCSYNDAEFVRVGYYVNNEYDTEEMRLEPPETPQPDRILRTILSDKPRVTRFPIRWDDILDETKKKVEDEEIDRDADTAFSLGAQQQLGVADESSALEDDDDDDQMMDDDDFTSQLGPEEQDRMSMMIDDDGSLENSNLFNHQNSTSTSNSSSLGASGKGTSILNEPITSTTMTL